MHCMYAMHCFKNAKCIVSDFKHAICMHCFDFLKKCMVSIKNFWKFKKICLKMHCFGQKVKKCIAFFSHFRKNACFRKILKLHTMQQPCVKPTFFALFHSWIPNHEPWKTVWISKGVVPFVSGMKKYRKTPPTAIVTLNNPNNHCPNARWAIGKSNTPINVDRELQAQTNA